VHLSLAERVSLVIELAAFLACLMFAAAATPQDASTSSYRSGQPTVTTDVKSAKVLYVSGDDLVVKGDDGQVKHFVVPDDFKFNVDGQDLTVHQLTPGMRLTRTITTTSTPRTVTTVRTIRGTVWHVNPPSTLILRLPGQANKQYKILEGQKFMIEGQERDAFHLRKGMIISATVVTESPEVVQSATQSVTGEAPPAVAVTPPSATPPEVGALLIEEPMSAEAEAAPDVAQSTLPKTGSMIPLIGLLGLLCLGASFTPKFRG
jgi:hypothetical protein